jgi:tetratricopeptide (TPR) repeat protein
MGKKKRSKKKRTPVSGVGVKDTHAQSPATHIRQSLWFCVFGIALTCLIVWHATLKVPFHYDDKRTVQENHAIRDLNNCTIFLEDFMNRGLLRSGYAVNYALAKTLPDGSPAPASFHTVNLLLHVINTLFVFWITLLVIQRRKGGELKNNILDAGCVAVLFAVFPIHTMTVNLIASRSVLQYATFSLLCLILAVLGLDPKRTLKKRLGFLVGASLALLCAVGSKSVGIVSVPLLGLLTYYLRAENKRGRITKKHLIFIGGSLLLCALLVLLLNRRGMVWQAEYHGLGTNLLTQAEVILHYLRVAIWPVGLSVEHDRLVAKSLLELKTALSVVTVLGVLSVGVILTIRRSLLGLCILWYYVALAPTSSIIPRANTIVEYRTYLAVIGVAGAVVLLLKKFASWLTLEKGATGKFRHRHTFAAGLCILVAIAMSGATVHRNRLFLDPVSLWADASRKSKKIPGPVYNLGNALHERGRLKEAVSCYRNALEIDPGFYKAHGNLGNVLALQGNLGEAVKHFREVLRVDPRDADAHYNLGITLARQGDVEKAIHHISEAVLLSPKHVLGHFNLGNLLASQGEYDKAMKHFEEALRIQPDFAEVRNRLKSLRELAIGQ